MDFSSFARSGSIPIISALLLGLMASIGPCTMATNIAALAYVGRQLTDRKYAILTGALYTAGRMFTYTVLGILIIAVGMETLGIAAFVQAVSEKFLGPFLIVIGLAFLFIDKISFGRGNGKLSAMGSKIANWGILGGFPLGALFALAFCPYSAVLFFAVLIPLSFRCPESISLPAFFAIGTGLPVLLFGTLLSFGVTRVSSWANAIASVEKVFRIIVALIFIGIGIYYTVLWIQTLKTVGG